MGRSEELMNRAVQCIPGGVNSPVRAYQSVDMTPRFISRADASHITDADGVEYIDYILSWGPMINGHNNRRVLDKVTEACQRGMSYGAPTEIEVEMAEFMTSRLPHVDMVRMVNSGTEAVMSAIRTARGFTGREKIIKFSGCYHGHSDCLLVDAGSGLMTAGVPGSAGVPAGCTKDTLTAVYNDLSSVEALFEANKGEIACLIVEPVAANMGVVLPEEGFLQGLRDICTREGALLIFDEVITGFRVAFGGAAELFGVTPDLVTYGKIIGGGMPVGAYGGKREIMEMVAPLGPVYQAGTLSGNPVAMAAGLEQLKILTEDADIYNTLAKKGEKLFGGINALLKQYNAPCTMNHIGSLGCIFFTPDTVKNYEDAKKADTAVFAQYFRHMLGKGIHLAPSQFEAMFLSVTHTEEDIDKTLELVEDYLKNAK
ncbi:MAG: glutamate-1-semialdehyde 2,1-aminomutase [Lachnospiraceae bacterium]|nr:glutamate-1-semialdehyde 2,1-aminomutase [Lachnospiraceae bacterium]